MRRLVSLFFLLSPLYVHAEMFRPFELLTPSLAERSDIRKLVNQLLVSLPDNQKDQVSTLLVGDVRLQFFTPVADFMTGLAQARATWSTSVDSQADLNDSPAAKNCTAHLEALVQVAAGETAHCSLEWQEALTSDFERSCTWVYEPERFVTSHTPGKVQESDMMTLEGLIRTVGSALWHLEFPTHFASPKWQNEKAKMRVVLTKIRGNELLAQLKNQDGKLRKAATSVCNKKIQLAALAQENQRAQNYIQNLISQGLAQAQEDYQRAIQQGFKRVAKLPYPALTDDEREWTSMYLGALYWRMRGGGLVDEPPGTQKARWYFTYLAMGVLGELNGGSEGQSAARNLYWPLIWKGWGRYFDMGRTKGEEDKYHDLVHMTDRGLYQVRSTALDLTDEGYTAARMIAGGLQMGPCYYYAWENLEGMKWAPEQPLPFQEFIDGPTAWGELCTGAAIALGLSQSLLGR